MNLLHSPLRWWLFGIPPLPRPEPSRPADPPGAHLSVAHPVLADRVRTVHSRVPLRVTSVYRSRADQQLFYDCYQHRLAKGFCPSSCARSACNSANPPGKSNHEAAKDGRPASLAVDMHPQDGNWNRLHRVCGEVGIHFPIRSKDPKKDEPWHGQPHEVPRGSFTQFPPGW